MQENQDSGFSRAVVVGAIAAFLGGGVWAAVVILANLELGWAAWGIGALVGASMAKVTTARGQTIGLIAALLAAAGLIAGKTLTVTVGTRPGLAKDIRSDSLWIAEAAAYQLRSSKTFPAPVQSQLDQMAESDTLSTPVEIAHFHRLKLYTPSVGTSPRSSPPPALGRAACGVVARAPVRVGVGCRRVRRGGACGSCSPGCSRCGSGGPAGRSARRP